MAAGVAVALWNPFLGAFLFLASGAAGCIAPSNDNVVFPAEHPSVVAVTCIDYGSGLVSNNCHYGSKVEFAAYQRFPTVYGGSETVDGLGGSSGATPTVAGQAALVWSKYPWMTRNQVLDRMRWAARASRDSRQGYGIVNTYKAVGGMYSAAIWDNLVSGGGFNEVAHYELHAQVQGGDGPFSYLWNNGQTTPTRSVAVGPGDPPHVYTVTITDASDGGTVRARIEIPPPPGGCEDPSKIDCSS
jgi:hypothetical protein